MSEIQTKKVVFFILPPKLITIILLFSLGIPFYTSNSSNAYLEARPTTSMKKGWLCRTSCDEKNEEITPFY